MAETERTEGQEVERELLIDASPEEVWEALTDAPRLREWLAEDVAELDLRPGGEFALDLEDGERRGFFEEVEAPRRLVFWWGAEEADSTRVEIELEPDGERTRVQVVESRPLLVLDAPAIEPGSWPGAGPPQMRAVASIHC